ncbi:MAG: T9SS type A sorting domain-containing protein [Fibrobacteres bacterium]|nr:T9SS type A sorting domain-containing protein [Fibrobacterota bacterium]
MFKMTNLAMLLILVLSGSSWAARGKALMLNATGTEARTTPGDLIMCTMDGTKRTYDTLVRGQVWGPGFSPDGKKIAYAFNSTVFALDLSTRASESLGTCAAFSACPNMNWTTDNKILWSDGASNKIFRIDVATKKRDTVHTGTTGRISTSIDGKRAAWVMPPRAAIIGGKEYAYPGGCGGAISPSGKYLSCNYNTGHKTINIYEFLDNGPAQVEIATVYAPTADPINGIKFGRSDSWLLFTTEVATPNGYISDWRTGTSIKVANLPIHDFFDESDVVPDSAELTGIGICYEHPNSPALDYETIYAGDTNLIKFVGYYTKGGKQYTCRITSGMTFTFDNSKLNVNTYRYTGLAAGDSLKLICEFSGFKDTCLISVLPRPKGTGFYATYYTDTLYTNKAFSRIDPTINFAWTHNTSPGAPIPNYSYWSAMWKGFLDVPEPGDYIFYFLQSEGNDVIDGYQVIVNDSMIITRKTGQSWNYPWVTPKASVPLTLAKGKNTITVKTKKRNGQTVIAKLWWSGPNMEQQYIRPIFVTPDSGQPYTSIEKAATTLTDEAFGVSVYPSPANPSAMIRLNGLTAGKFNVTLFSSNGQIVRTWNNMLSSGKSSAIVWNGRDNRNNALASGIYTVRIEQDKRCAVTRTLLVR